MPRFKDNEEYEDWKAERLENPHKPEKPDQPPEPDRKSDDIIKKSIAAGILIISISIGYYYIIYMPELNAQKERELKEQSAITLQKAEAEDMKKKQEELVRSLNEEEKRKHSERESAWIKEELIESHLETERQKQEALKEETLKKERLSDCIDNAWASYHEEWSTNCEEIGLEDACSLPPDVSQSYSDNRKKALDNCNK
jgi:hypothetical protein